MSKILRFHAIGNIQLARLITLPLLHAIFAGIFAHFIALASINRHVEKGLVLAGLASAAVLHGVYDTLSNSFLGVIIAVISVIIFVAYYRSSEALQCKLTALNQQRSAKAAQQGGAGGKMEACIPTA